MKKILLICLLILACEEKYLTLWHEDLDETEIADITAFLKENKYKYKLENNDSTILVPRETHYEIRMAMARNGLPKNHRFICELPPVKSIIQDPRDGKTYKTTKIGEQIWMAENLNYAAKGSKCGSVERIVADYRERDSIRAKYDSMGIIIDFADYANTLKDENTEYCDKYGRLYNWKTATTACPKGWRMPNNSEWQKLITAIGGNSTSSIKLKAKSWGNGTDDYNFTALPSGYANNDSIFHPGITAEWWSLTEHNATQAYSHKITYSPSVRLDTIFKSSYGSLRCVKD